MSKTNPSEAPFDPLLLKNQLCFPLYACARKIVAAYTPFLRELGLTYPQYITMMVLWEEQEIPMHDLGTRLFLDSGTLTPVLKRLEAADLLTRKRSVADERCVIVRLTEKGRALRARAKRVPHAMGCLLNKGGEVLSAKEATQLKEQLYRIIAALQEA